ncbi:MAG: hypothetical protein COV36_03580 [Alphaproteobacteria bacterium CG11_big_fil_rev_8_21_14_0_20_44_7]|nr:MAG: hypothetical protein COV36_03580 [Alphaproteobacteria bacterium CG11_big_fil_rev_8_21_14_0_20_44_7]
MKKILFILTFALLPIPAIAEGECNMQNRGKVMCMEQRMCECKYFTAGVMTNDPGGYRWDCGIMQGNCLDYQTIDSTKPYDGPQAVELDNSSDNITIENQ